MTYIKLDSVIDEIGAYIEDGYEDEVRRLLNCSSASVDFEEMIKEMIEEMRNKEYMYDLDMVKIDALQELLNNLPK